MTTYTDFDEWRDAVKRAYPHEAQKLQFKGRVEHGHDTVSAEIPGQDRCYGVWDGNKDEGVILEATTMKATSFIQRASTVTAAVPLATLLANHLKETDSGSLTKKIAAALQFPGKITHDDESVYSPEDIGRPGAKGYADTDASTKWQDTEFKDCELLIKDKNSALDQWLFKHKTKPLYYWVATDGESGMYGVVRMQKT